VSARGSSVARLAARAWLASALLAWGPAVTRAAAEPAPPPSLQALVDATAPFATLIPPPGHYAGPVVLRRPIQLDGRGQVTIDGGGQGSVVQIRTDDAVVRGLHLIGSGANPDHLDAGVQVRGNRNRVEDNRIEDCLFGIDLKQADDNLVRGNQIRSKAFSLGERGDGIRLWYSKRNRVLDNRVTAVRDLVVWYSLDNVFAGNRVQDSRYGLHFMYAHRNQVRDNEFIHDSVGIFLMYSDHLDVTGNRIVGAAGPTGLGIGLKESSQVTAHGNSVAYCARGIYLDVSPYDPETTNTFSENRIAYNGMGIVFHNDWHGNVFAGNALEGNFAQVTVDDGSTASHNDWQGNYWADYQGFDRNRDGRGDAPYELYDYADKIWIEQPEAAFFRGSPLLELIDFLDRLAPFSLPTRVLEDPAPRMRASGSPS